MASPDYDPALGVEAYIKLIDQALPMTIHELQRRGVSLTLVNDLAPSLGVSRLSLLTWLGSKPRNAALQRVLKGLPGISVLGLLALLADAQRLVAQLPDAKLDPISWFGGWVQLPQPALGGRRPCDLLDTPQGAQMIKRVMGAITSGVYL